MASKAVAFEKTYRGYLKQVEGVEFQSIEEKLGVLAKGSEVIVPLLGKPYRISGRDVTGPEGKRPDFDKCVILLKYILMCPEGYPRDKTWVSYRDLRNSGPLTAYFRNDVERAFSGRYKGRVDDLEKSCKLLGGYPPDIKPDYDLSMQFDLLPKVPLLILFNDMDDEFPAKCTVLFERRAEEYLDAECLAIAGRILFDSLRGLD